MIVFNYGIVPASEGFDGVLQFNGLIFSPDVFTLRKALSKKTRISLKLNGKNILEYKIKVMVTIKRVWFDETRIFVELSDAKVIGTPISWYPNLRKGTPTKWQKFEIWGNGTWLHWEDLDEDLDEDLSLEGFLSYKEPAKA